MDGDNLSTGEAGLSSSDLDELWELFIAIHSVWGSQSCRPEDMASRWREFIQLKISESPSYATRYRDGCELISELRVQHGDDLYQYLLLNGQLHSKSNSRLADLKRYVIDEFIRVYVSSGGFRSFGGKNYSGFVSGSRFRSQPPYRTFGIE